MPRGLDYPNDQGSGERPKAGLYPWQGIAAPAQLLPECATQWKEEAVGKEREDEVPATELLGCGSSSAKHDIQGHRKEIDRNGNQERRGVPTEPDAPAHHPAQ